MVKVTKPSKGHFIELEKYDIEDLANCGFVISDDSKYVVVRTMEKTYLFSIENALEIANEKAIDRAIEDYWESEFEED